MAKFAPEKPLLKRLRQAVRQSGLHADLSQPGLQDQVIVAPNRLAQTTIRYLISIDLDAGQRLLAELRGLAEQGEYDLFMEERGYTFFHVVQFLYEFAKHYGHPSQQGVFCAGMGRGGGGIEIDPNREIRSLLLLLTTALPAAAEEYSFRLLLQQLGVQIMGQLFVPGLFRIEVAGLGEGRLRIGLNWTDEDQVRQRLAALGLAGDIGAFFFNEALHFEGTLQLGVQTFVRNADGCVEIDGLVGEDDGERVAAVKRGCRCAWEVSWSPDIELRRLSGAEEIIELGAEIYEVLHRKDLEYYLERIKTLETQVQALTRRDCFHDLIGKSAQMQQVFHAIEQVACADFTVLVRGESGTGKELVAQAIHRCSERRDGPFIAVNCAAFSETLLESELFGHEQGAFTGADHTKPGRFESAGGGTLFLDEVGDVSPAVQVKLLRVLETRTFERVGGIETQHTDIRIVGATNRDLEQMVAEQSFREDLYFRLNVLPIELPPLREHPDDIPLLARHFLEQTARSTGREVSGFSRGAIERLMGHVWSGNVRELLNVIERAVVVYARGSTLTEADISQALGQPNRVSPGLRLNMRQRQVLDCIGFDGHDCRIEDLLGQIEDGVDGSGTSRRTLQNDLRKLTELGLLRWYKAGSARVYTLTIQGQDLHRTCASYGFSSGPGSRFQATGSAEPV